MFDLLPFWSISDAEEATINNWIQVFSAEKGSYACLPNPQSIDPPTQAWQANRLLQTYQENWTPTQHSFYNKTEKCKEPQSAPSYRDFQSHRSLPNADSLSSSAIPRAAWNRFIFILMESCCQSCLSTLSHTHFRCALMRGPLFAQLVLARREPGASITYWATIFTFHFSATHSGRKLSGRYCDEITMSFSLSKELQSAGMKEAGLMGEMITCHG